MITKFILSSVQNVFSFPILVGGGHFSPIGAYNSESDSFLILGEYCFKLNIYHHFLVSTTTNYIISSVLMKRADVAKYKYRPVSATTAKI